MSMKIQSLDRPSRWRSICGVSLLALSCLAVSIDVAHARGGTAKPPVVSATPYRAILPPAGPVLPSLGIPTGSNGLSITGMVQSATLHGGRGAGLTAGRPVTINGLVITIPSDTIV